MTLTLLLTSGYPCQTLPYPGGSLWLPQPTKVWWNWPVCHSSVRVIRTPWLLPAIFSEYQLCAEANYLYKQSNCPQLACAVSDHRECSETTRRKRDAQPTPSCSNSSPFQLQPPAEVDLMHQTSLSLVLPEFLTHRNCESTIKPLLFKPWRMTCYWTTKLKQELLKLQSLLLNLSDAIFQDSHPLVYARTWFQTQSMDVTSLKVGLHISGFYISYVMITHNYYFMQVRFIEIPLYDYQLLCISNFPFEVTFLLPKIQSLEFLSVKVCWW